jgi:hypothetical protein
MGLVYDYADLGTTIKMPIIIDGKRHEKEFAVEDFPQYLVLPQFHDSPGMLLGGSPTDSYGTVSYSIWGIEEQLRALHAEGNAILVEGFNLDFFGRALAKIAHGFVAGELGLDTFEPYLPDYILGTAPQHGSYFIGKWRDEVEKPRPPGLLHQVGVAVVQSR